MNNSFICPNCGTEVRVGSASCTGCGSDDNTGWSDDTIYDGIEIAWLRVNAGGVVKTCKSSGIFIIDPSGDLCGERQTGA